MSGRGGHKDISKWKREDVTTTTKQLERIFLAAVEEQGTCDDIRDDSSIRSLAKICSVLDPLELTRVGIGASLAFRHHRLLEKKKLLASLKSETAEIKLEREMTKDTTLEIQESIRIMNEKLQSHSTEMSTTNLNELKLSTRAYKTEIEVEMPGYTQVSTAASICSEGKIDELMKEIASRYEKAEKLSTDLEFTKGVPADIWEIKSRLDVRQKHLQDLCNRFEDLAEYR